MRPHRKPASHSFARYSRLLLLASVSSAAFAASAADLPIGGQITAGAGSISQSGTTLTVNQSTQNMAADWQSFSIGQGHTVNFVQPSADSVALNRVIGSDPSNIQGALNANGKVFLINPNGVLFSPTAQVNTGGLVASTLALSNDNFLSGKYEFAGDSSNAIINQGNIQTVAGGTVALIGAQITNTGTIRAPEGNVLLGAGSAVTLDLGGPVKLQVTKGALNSTINQGGAIMAHGGQVYLTSKGAENLAASVINHTGITEAQTLSSGKKGKIVLIADMKTGTANVSGKLDASAPHGGDGGFIETSGANVNIASDLIINAGAAAGKGGLWLIDPYDYTIDASAATTIVNALNNSTNVTISTAANVGGYGSNGNNGSIGDINVNTAINKTNGNEATLRLEAANSIILNSQISSNSNKLNLQLFADYDADGAGIIMLNDNITSNGGNIDFGNNTSITLNGVSTKVGGDVFIGGGSAITLSSGGGNINVHGQTLIANTNGFTINTGGGNLVFDGLVDSGNSYTGVNSVGGINWANALTAAQGSTGGADQVGDTYLATITSRLENAVAGRAVGYNPSWLGGRRLVGVGTDAVWRWIAGPEGMMDGGKGLGFFTQNGSASVNGTGGTAINGAFNNWNAGEPNNSGGPNLSAETEPSLQFVGNLGRWNDLPRTSSTLNYYVQETNLAPSALTINAGAGDVTFSSAVGSNKVLSSLGITATNININGGAVTTAGAQTYNGDVKLGSASTTLTMTDANTDFTLGANRTIANNHSTDASLTIKTTRGIIMEATSAISSASHKLNTLFWSDSDNSNGGSTWLKGTGSTGASITTNGGTLTISGGTDTTTGYATGSTGTQTSGILLDNATINTNGGNIVMRGKSAVTGTTVTTSQGNANNTDGIRILGSNLVDSGTGTISLTGVALGNSGSSNGIEINTNTGYTKFLSAAANTTAISFNGDASGGSSADGWGTFFGSNANAGVLLAATGTNGGITINGTGRNVTNGGGVHFEPSTFVLASSGPISITGAAGTASTYEDIILNGTTGFASTLPAGFSMASTVTSSTSNISLIADTLKTNRVLGSGSTTNSAIQSSGTLTIAPRTNGKAMTIQNTNPSDGSAWIDLAAMTDAASLFKNSGFSKIIFGNSTTGTVKLHNYALDKDTQINTGSNVILGDITMPTQTLRVNVTGGGTITDIGAVAISKLALVGTSASALLDGITNAISTLAANLASLSILNNTAMAVGTADGITGVNATGAVALATRSGDLTVSQAITTTSTGNDAITLNAGKTTAAGTAAGGNVLLNNTLTTGAGGRATIYTGSITNSTGVAAAAGAGHYRYNSNDGTTNYTTALGTGTYAIYRERPVITITAPSATKTYDGNAYNASSGAVITGFVNSETSAIFSGSLTYGGTAQGNINAGDYSITNSGYTNGLGYGMNYVAGNLHVDKATLTYNATPQTLSNAELPSASFAGTVTGFLGSDTLNNATTGTLSFIPGASAFSPAGIYALNGSGLNAINYNFVQAASNASALTLKGDNGSAAVTATQTTASNIVSQQPLIFTQPVLSPPPTPTGPTTIGNLEIVPLNSNSSGSGKTASGAFNLAQDAGRNNSSGLMQLFVVDSGITLSGQEKDSH